MPKKPIERARQDEREGKAPSTQAGEFVREEIELIREGAHGARSTKQAIAIGLSKARRAGVKLPPPKKGTIPEKTREKAKHDLEKAQEGGAKPTLRRRSQATLKTLKREALPTGTTGPSGGAMAANFVARLKAEATVRLG